MNLLQPHPGAGRPNDLLIVPESLPWTRASPGLEFQMLNWDPASGAYAIMMRYSAGWVASTHRHLAPAEFYVVSGLMVYGAGAAPAGSFGIEPTGAVHTETRFPEDTLLLFRSAGPVAALDADRRVTAVIEGRNWFELATGQRRSLV
jgi:hypothetical protein